MTITIIGEGTSTRPVFRHGAVPANTLVPSRRETIEALEVMERLTRTHDHAMLLENRVITWDQALDTLQRFVLTR